MAKSKSILQIEALASNLEKLNSRVENASAVLQQLELDGKDTTQAKIDEKNAKNKAKLVQKEYNDIVGESAQTFKTLAEDLRNFSFEVNKNKDALGAFGIKSNDLGQIFSQLTDTQSTLTTEIEQRKKVIDETANLSKERRDVLEEEIREREHANTLYKGINTGLSDAVKSIEKIGMGGNTTIDYRARALQRQQAGGDADLNTALDAQFGLEDAVVGANKSFQETVGVVGKVKDGITDITDKIPLIGGRVSKFINGQFDKAVSIIEGDLQESLDGTEEGLKKTGIQGRILNMIMKANPLLIFASVVIGIALAFRGLNKAARDLSNELSMGKDQLDGQLASLKMQQLQFELIGLDAEKIKTTLTTLSTEFKDLELVTAENAANIERFAQNSGVGGDEVAKLTKQLMITEGISFDMALSMQEQAAAMAKTAGIAKGSILSDMASNAESFARFSQQGAEGLAEAAVAANQMGLNLEKVLKVAGDLLDFEGSITKEFEAQVLTGRAINLEKARQAALSGDQDSLMREIKSVAMGVNLETMNVVQKDAIAGAIGLSVSDLMRVSRGESLDKQETQIDLQKKTNDILIAGFNEESDVLDKIANNTEKSAGGPNMYGGIVDSNVNMG